MLPKAEWNLEMAVITEGMLSEADPKHYGSKADPKGNAKSVESGVNQ